MIQRQRSGQDSAGVARGRKSDAGSKLHQVQRGSSVVTFKLVGNSKPTTTASSNTIYYGKRTNENTPSSVNDGAPPIKKSNFRFKIITLPAVKQEPVDNDNVICMSYPTKVKVKEEEDTFKGLLSNIFYCHHCNYSTVQKNKLRTHAQRHLPPSFFCKHCPYKTYCKSLFKSHSLKHSKRDKPFACDLCDYKCSWKHNLKDHVIFVHSDDRPYTCPLCPFKAKVARLVKEHFKRHTGLRDVKCPHEGCSYTAYSKYAMNQHFINRHSDEKRFACPVCDFRAKHKARIDEHYRYKHERILKYSCPHCDHRSAIKSNMTTHIKSHNKYKRFQCNLCEGWFRSSGTLKNHFTNVHENARAYRCFHCDFRANQLPGLRVHVEEIHLKLKPFQCQLCEYRAYRRTAVRRHMQGHGPDRPRPFACSKCDSKFHEKRGLEHHMAVHTDAKPYKCSKCDYRGKTMVHLNTHRREVHQTSNRNK
uniref:Transcriptional repressor CTCF n=1 Tax=Lygus hesperus TaxID=30085 RepID=A0A0A9ZB28_LYGHE